MAKKQQIIQILVLLVLSIILVKCAHQMAPPGGDKDITPPVIISTYPENGTTNFKDNTIEFSFSEYVNKRNINEALFISPIMEVTPEISWTNRTVEMIFTNGFNENTTYSIIIGTEITDVNNNNKMIKPFVLTFSTGDHIDSGMIAGTVYEKKSDGTLIFAYKKVDTLDVLKQKPNYISQIDEKGKFNLSGLSSGEYLILAVKDEFKDLIYNVGEDKLGIPYKQINISDTTKTITDLNFFMHKEDTLAPDIQNVTMTDRNHIIIEFNEPIDSSRLSVSNFTVYDSTSNRSTPLQYLYKGNISKHQYIVTLSDSIYNTENIYLLANNIFDKNKNELKSENVNFIPSYKKDTVAIKLNRIDSPLKRGVIDYLSPQFDVLFTDAFDTLEAKKGISLFDKDSNKVPISIKFLDNATVRIKPMIDLKPRESYKFFTDMKYFIDQAGNKVDTTIFNRISTVNNLDFSGASGKINFNGSKNIKVVLEKAAEDGKRIINNIDDNNEFNFQRVLPGEYLLWTFIDEDSNDIYSHGTLTPFKEAEYFKYYPDTLNLRARWPVGDIFIDLSEKK